MDRTAAGFSIDFRSQDIEADGHETLSVPGGEIEYQSARPVNEQDRMSRLSSYPLTRINISTQLGRPVIHW